MASSNSSEPELSREEAIKVLEMFLHKQCSLGRTEFAYDANTVWEAVKMATDNLKTDEIINFCMKDPDRGIIVPENATNGDMMIAIYGIVDVEVNERSVRLFPKDGGQLWVTRDWWEATYTVEEMKQEQEPCEDAISRKSIEQKLWRHHDFFVDAYGGFSNLPLNDKSRVDEILNCISMVVNEPPVTPQEPRTGHWISHREHCEMNNLLPSGLGSYCWCSECDCGIDSKYFHRAYYNYCPNCGAKME